MDVPTVHGTMPVFRFDRHDRPAYVVFRHGRPHGVMPQQINYRAQAAALRELGAGALLVTSSVGVLRADVPLNTPMVVNDLLMPENRLPDGSQCTMFVEPSDDQAHLVLEHGLFDTDMNRQLTQLGAAEHSICFAYAPGPRTKTAAENRYWASLGADVNSMTVGPEVVLANEHGTPTAALVVGHKYSHPDIPNRDVASLESSLMDARASFESLVVQWLETASPVTFKNSLFRF